MAIAERYESEKEAARKRSGFDDALASELQIKSKIFRLATAIAEIAPVTMADLVIHARAYLALALIELPHSSNLAPGRGLAEAIVRLNVGGAS
jgi:hypothetical protein